MLQADPRDATTFHAPIASARVPVVLEDTFGGEHDLEGASVTVRSVTTGTATAEVVAATESTPAYIVVDFDGLPDDGPVLVGLTLEPAVGDAIQVAPFAIVVEGDTGFHTLTSIRERWPDAPKSDLYLWELLDLARIACLAYAPIKAGERVPSGHRAAQLNLCRAAAMRLAGSVEESVGLEGQGVRIYLDDADTRRLLRPRRARGGIA